jgi:hypothetical protein
VLGVLLGYNGQHDAQREAIESFAIPDGSVRMAEVTSSVVKRMFLRYGIDPVSGRGLVPGLHLDELSVSDISGEQVVRRMLKSAAKQNLGSIETSDPATAQLFYDEFSLLRSNDPLVVKLHQIEGVPNATYLVRGEQVFVFDKLVELVEALGMKIDDPELPDLARQLVDAASVSPAPNAVDSCIQSTNWAPGRHKPLAIFQTGGVPINSATTATNARSFAAG